MINIFKKKDTVSMNVMYSIPQTHIIFVGPIECARHNCRMNFKQDSISFLCPSDAEIALGMTEKLIEDGIEELAEHYEGNLRGILFFTGCQTSFMEVDFDMLACNIYEKHGIQAVHYEESRFKRFDQAIQNKKSLYETLLDMIPVKEDKMQPDIHLSENAKDKDDLHFDENRRMFIMSGNIPFSSENELYEIAEQYGVSNLSGSGMLADFDEFSSLKNVCLNLVIDRGMKQTALYMEERFGIKWLYMPVTYRLKEIDLYYDKLDEFFECLTDRTYYRNTAIREIDRALAATEGQRISVDFRDFARPWDAVRALAEYGFELDKVSIRENMGLPHRERPGKSDKPPRHRETVMTENEKWVREHFPKIEIIKENPFNGMKRTLPRECIFGTNEKPFAWQKSDSAENERWGYAALCFLMSRIRNGDSDEESLE